MDVEYEEKKTSQSLTQVELDKENDYYMRPASPAHKRCFRSTLPRPTRTIDQPGLNPRMLPFEVAGANRLTSSRACRRGRVVTGIVNTSGK